MGVDAVVEKLVRVIAEITELKKRVDQALGASMALPELRNLLSESLELCADVEGTVVRMEQDSILTYRCWSFKEARYRFRRVCISITKGDSVSLKFYEDNDYSKASIELSTKSNTVETLLTLSRNAETISRVLDALLERARGLAEKAEREYEEAQRILAALRLAMTAMGG